MELMPDRTRTVHLREDRIVATVAKLRLRIDDRFPGSSLSNLCGDLHDVARQSAERSRWIGRPIRWIRATGYVVSFALVAAALASVAYALSRLEGEQVKILEVVSATEAAINELIFLAIAVAFLVTWETRIKRRRALSAIHELRSIAHVIDMHQLTKDPERLMRDWRDAEHSPRRTLTALELNRYLDYCTEMLSLVGKIAALYIQDFDDSQAAMAVSEVEELTTGLSRKVWQKIVMLEQIEARLRGAPSDSSPDDDPEPVGPAAGRV